MYFGSVRFFKHLIITVLVIVILLPYITVIVFGVKYSEISKRLDNTQTAINTLSDSLPQNMETMRQNIDDSALSQNTALRDELESYISDQTNKLSQQTDASITDKTDKLDKSISSRIAALQQQLTKYAKEQNNNK